MAIEPEIRTSIIQFLREATGSGLFPLVAYGVSDGNLSLLTSNIRDLTLAISILEEVTGQDYNLGRYVPETLVERLLRGNPHVYRRHVLGIQGIGNFDRDDRGSLGRLISVFGAPFYRTKAFGLIDICGFSRMSYSEQLAYLYSIDNLFRQAVARVGRFCEQLRTPAAFCRASTGDGFYIWSNALGGNADVAVFMLLMCLLERAERLRVGSLKLKASYVIDSTFLLFDQSGEIPEYPESINAVGAATNGAARLVTAARSSQVLVGNFSLRGQGNETFDPASLLRQANELFRVEGSGAATLRLAPDRMLKVVDKHEDAWDCWNICGEIPAGDEAGRSTIGVQPDSAQNIQDLQFRR